MSFICSVGIIVEEGMDPNAPHEYEVYMARRSDMKLRMSRSFGDFCLKQNLNLPSDQQAVIAVPDVVIRPRSIRLEPPALPLMIHRYSPPCDPYHLILLTSSSSSSSLLFYCSSFSAMFSFFWHAMVCTISWTIKRSWISWPRY